MTRNPILKALSILFTSETKALLMGGQACILYGAAEFSRDIDLAVLVSPENLNSLGDALSRLKADPVYVPLLDKEVLQKGHACHFRCNARGVKGLRVDVMGKMRGVEDFRALWERRAEIELPGVGRVSVMALEDLVRAKKTQRDKDWPMIRRLVDADLHRHGLQAPADRIRFWLSECRTPEILLSLSETYPNLAREIAAHRTLLAAALEKDAAALARLLRAEEDREKELDRQYWMPLKAELERWRRERKYLEDKGSP